MITENMSLPLIRLMVYYIKVRKLEYKEDNQRMDPTNVAEGWLSRVGSVEGYKKYSPIDISEYAIENNIQEDLALN